MLVTNWQQHKHPIAAHIQIEECRLYVSASFPKMNFVVIVLFLCMSLYLSLSLCLFLTLMNDVVRHVVAGDDDEDHENNFGLVWSWGFALTCLEFVFAIAGAATTILHTLRICVCSIVECVECAYIIYKTIWMNWFLCYCCCCHRCAYQIQDRTRFIHS